MGKLGVKHFYLFILGSILFTSCDKGYQVRFTNYYLEPMDSVVIGNNQVVFTNIGLEQTTELRKISRGKHFFTLTTKTKKKFYSSFFVPSKGSGNRTIQIDAIKQIFVLEE